MKSVVAVVGTLQVLQIYRLSLCLSTAIEVLLTILNTSSWIQILVRPIKRSIIIIQILLISILHLDLYSELCTIEVDLSHLWRTPNIRTMKKRSGSGVYYEVDYELVMLIGGTEIEVQLCWKENVRLNIF